MTTLIDTDVLLDLATDDPVWASWSLSKLDGASLSGPIVINPIIYAELAARYPDTHTLDEFIVRLGADVENIPKAGLFLAGKAFQLYRQRGGTKTGVLADFLIGGHAAVSGLSLLTRGRARYASYFPTVKLIAPDQG